MNYRLGPLLSIDVLDVSASNLMKGYARQAGKKACDIFTKAWGKVLFINEAYQLNPKNGGTYMQEVVDQIVKCITSQDFIKRLVIILVGYEKDINVTFSFNQGLR